MVEDDETTAIATLNEPFNRCNTIVLVSAHNTFYKLPNNEAFLLNKSISVFQKQGHILNRRNYTLSLNNISSEKYWDVNPGPLALNACALPTELSLVASQVYTSHLTLPLAAL